MYTQTTTPAIVLKRVNYSESDKIITFLTPTGKISAMVKGVRKQGSKLSGGIELFSIAQITVLDSKSNLKRVTSSRLINYFENIVKELPIMMFAYECLKLINHITPEQTDDNTYFLLICQCLGYLNSGVSPALVELWWNIKALSLLGEELNLLTDIKGQALESTAQYQFNLNHPILERGSGGLISADHIKFLRLLIERGPDQAEKIQGYSALIKPLQEPIKAFVQLAYSN